MKKVIMLMALCLGMSSVYAKLPSRANINFNLIESSGNCPAVLNNAKVAIDYDYDFDRNMGLAYIRRIESARWATVLHPMGIAGYYGFMSDIPPTEIQVNGVDVTVFRIIFHLQKDGEVKLIMMFNQDGDCIMTSNTDYVVGV